MKYKNWWSTLTEHKRALYGTIGTWLAVALVVGIILLGVVLFGPSFYFGIIYLFIFALASLTIYCLWRM